MVDPVRLRITDADAPDRSVLMPPMPRERAEAIVLRMIELWGVRYLCSIEPLTEE